MISLQILYNFIQSANNLRFLLDNKLAPNSISEYYATTKESYSKGCFYLGGIIKLKPDDIITDEHIKEVKTSILNRTRHDCANSWEYYSCSNHDKRFHNLVDIIDFLKLNKTQ